MQVIDHKCKSASRRVPQECEMLRLVLLHATSKDISQHLGISVYTACNSASALLDKNPVNNGAQLIALHVAPRRKTNSQLLPAYDGLYR